MVERDPVSREPLGYRVRHIFQSLSLAYQAQHVPDDLELADRAVASLMVIENEFSVAGLRLTLHLTSSTRYMAPRERAELFEELGQPLVFQAGRLAIDYMMFNLAAMTVDGAAVNGLQQRIPEEPDFARRLALERDIAGDQLPEARLKERAISRRIKELVGKAEEPGHEPLRAATALLRPIEEI